MDKIMGMENCQHKSLAEGGWAKMPFYLQMGNLGRRFRGR